MSVLFYRCTFKSYFYIQMNIDGLVLIAYILESDFYFHGCESGTS